MIELDPQLLELMTERHKRLSEAAALAGAIELEANLSHTEGTGVKYPGLPNRSSAPHEYPVLQSGRLMSGVGVEPGSGTSTDVVIHDSLGKLLGLEFSPPSENPNQPGTPRRTSGGRAPMWRTFNDQRTQNAMAAAMEKAI